jgi:two-component sensor histidine kinase
MSRREKSVCAIHDFRFTRRDGSTLDALVSACPLVDDQGEFIGSFAMVTDISERKRTEELLRRSLAEKEVLLREIHHRVKNNLQVVSSLLYLQAQTLTDPELQKHFLESQSRICSMALAYEQLYQSKSLAEVSVRSYVESLAGQLQEVFQLPGQQIECRTVIGDIVLHIERLIPCGLLITELLSNAYKHAFADGRKGIITISMEQVGEQYVLSVADDGVGMPAGLDYRQSTSLGLQLVSALVSQLNGTLEIEQEGGTLFRVTFAESVDRDN